MREITKVVISVVLYLASKGESTEKMLYGTGSIMFVELYTSTLISVTLTCLKHEGHRKD